MEAVTDERELTWVVQEAPAGMVCGHGHGLFDGPDDPMRALLNPPEPCGETASQVLTVTDRGTVELKRCDRHAGALVKALEEGRRHTRRERTRNTRLRGQHGRLLPPPARRRGIRVRAGLTQGQLGQRLGGVSTSTVSRYESGERLPTGKEFDAYVDLLQELEKETNQREAGG